MWAVLEINLSLVGGFEWGSAKTLYTLTFFQDISKQSPASETKLHVRNISTNTKYAMHSA